MKIGEILRIRRKFCEENIEIVRFNYKQSNFQQTKSNKTTRLVCHFKHFYYLGGQKKCGARVHGSRSGVNQELGNYLRVGVSQSIHSDLFHLAMLLKDSTLPFVVPLSFKKALT